MKGAEARRSELEDKNNRNDRVWITENRLTNEQGLKDSWNSNKRSIVSIIRVLEGEKRKKRAGLKKFLQR